MALIKLSSKERVNIIYLLERQIRMAEKALNTPTMGNNNYDDFKNQINNNNITIIKNNKMKTAVEYLEERLNLSLGNELKSLRGFFVIAKEMEKSQIEKAIEDGYVGCCGKKTTVKLKGNFWEREEKWDEQKSINEIIINSKNKPELKVKCLHCGRKFIGKLHHKCNTGYRKNNHKWEEI